MAAINPHLKLTTYGGIKPGDRVVNGYLRPTHPDAHHLARTVREIVRTYRNTGFTPNWALPRAERIGRPSHGFKYYDYEVIVWRDTNGSLFEDRADETVYITPAD